MMRMFACMLLATAHGYMRAALEARERGAMKHLRGEKTSINEKESSRDSEKATSTPVQPTVDDRAVDARPLELTHLLRHASDALINSSTKGAHEYLPPPETFAKATKAALEADWLRIAERDSHAFLCAAWRAASNDQKYSKYKVKYRNINETIDTGVAKALKYAAEMVVSAAASGKVLVIRKGSRFRFSRGVTHDNCGESWQCFMSSSVCMEDLADDRAGNGSALEIQGDESTSGEEETSDRRGEPLVDPLVNSSQPSVKRLAVSSGTKHLLPRCGNQCLLPSLAGQKLSFWSEASSMADLPLAVLQGMHLAFAYRKLLHGLENSTQRAVQEMLRTVSSETQKGKNVIGMSVRRGDSCAFDGRACYNVTDYVAAARKLRTLYGDSFSTVNVITDQPSVIDELRQAGGEFEWRYLNFRRFEGFFSSKEEVLEKDIDHTAPDKVGQRNAFLVQSMLADLMFASEARVWVGTLSYVSQSAMLLMWAQHGVLPPTILLDKSAPPLLNMFAYRYIGKHHIKKMEIFHNMTSGLPPDDGIRAVACGERSGLDCGIQHRRGESGSETGTWLPKNLTSTLESTDWILDEPSEEGLEAATNDGEQRSHQE